VIRRLRSRHRTMTVGLALVAPAILAAGLLARRAVPGGLAGDANLPPSEKSHVVTSIGDDGSISSVLYELGTSPSGLAVALSLDVDPGRPEWLAYWSPEERTVGGRLPDEAWLLGALTGNGYDRFALPGPASRTRGRILVYVPIDGEVVAGLELRNLP
jgi:hypothetical protein